MAVVTPHWHGVSTKAQTASAMHPDMRWGYSTATAVQPAKTVKKRCAFTGHGIHYHSEPGPFCSRECQKRDDRQGPSK
jgi:hypothetical protein